MPSLNDAADYREPYVAPYVPRGFRLEDSKPSTPPSVPGFVIETSNGVYHFVKEFFVKGDMTNDERAYFLDALENWKHGQITLPELQRVAEHPDQHDSYGNPIPAVPKVEKENVVNDVSSNPDSRNSEAIELIRMRFTGDDVEKLTMMGWWPLRPAFQTIEEKTDVYDPVDHPSHYTHYKGVEVIDITEQLNFNRGNAVKYLARAGLKNKATEIQDLQKALWYVTRELSRIADVGKSYEATADATILIEQMSFNRGNAVGCISHAGTWYYGSAESDLEKAVYFIECEINRMKKLEEG